MAVVLSPPSRGRDGNTTSRRNEVSEHSLRFYFGGVSCDVTTDRG